MSRRKRRTGETPAPRGGAGDSGGQAAGSGESGGPAARGGSRGGASDAAGSGRRRSTRSPSRSLAVDLALLIAVCAVTVGIAELAGAANLGVAFGVGQVAFAIALVALLLRE
jgi:hypothetical protein